MNPLRMSVLKRSLVSALMISTCFSTWTYFVNFSHPAAIQLKAALTQGTVSLIFGFSMTLLLEWSIGRFQGHSHSLIRIAMPILLTMIIVISVTVIAHWVMQTPEILATILLPACAGFTFCSVYTIKRSKSPSLAQNGTLEL
jgi:hypothetical protein